MKVVVVAGRNVVADAREVGVILVEILTVVVVMTTYPGVYFHGTVVNDRGIEVPDRGIVVDVPRTVVVTRGAVVATLETVVVVFRLGTVVVVLRRMTIVVVVVVVPVTIVEDEVVVEVELDVVVVPLCDVPPPPPDGTVVDEVVDEVVVVVVPLVPFVTEVAESDAASFPAESWTAFESFEPDGSAYATVIESPLWTVVPSARRTLFVEIVTDETVMALPFTRTVNALVDAVVDERFSSYVIVNWVPAAFTAALWKTGAVVSLPVGVPSLVFDAEPLPAALTARILTLYEVLAVKPVITIGDVVAAGARVAQVEPPLVENS